MQYFMRLLIIMNQKMKIKRCTNQTQEPLYWFSVFIRKNNWCYRMKKDTDRQNLTEIKALTDWIYREKILVVHFVKVQNISSFYNYNEGNDYLRGNTLANSDSGVKRRPRTTLPPPPPLPDTFQRRIQLSDDDRCA